MKKIIFKIIICLLIIGLVYGAKEFMNTDYFKIVNVTVNSSSKLIKDDIIKELLKLKGQNIFYVNSKVLENKIKSDARVNEVKVKKKYPSDIIVDIKEREPYVYVRKEDNFFLADRELNVFGYINEYDLKDIPIVNYVDDNSLNDMKIIVSKIKNNDLYNMISEITKENKYYVLLLNNRVKFITDTLVNEDKYDKSFKLYKTIKDEQPIEYIDIRFKDVNVK